MASVLERLTEGMVNRDLAKEGAALRAKWEKTGLLEGLGGGRGHDQGRRMDNMARLLETQAKELLREASVMSQGDVEGFAAVAFPIVRRVFGGLIANDLVSVQPMSLPSGLIFFLDFQHTNARLGYGAEDSLYGGGAVGQQITGGVDLGGTNLANAESGFYSLHQGYASPTGSQTAPTITEVTSGTFGSGDNVLDRLCRYDPDLTSGTTTVAVARVAVSALETGGLLLNRDNLAAITLGSIGGATKPVGAGSNATQIRRLSDYSASDKLDINLFLVSVDGTVTAANLVNELTGGNADLTVEFPLADNFAATPAAGSTNAVGAIAGQAEWGLEENASIPEIDIKVDSVSITAITKKLKAKWTPELGQDLNAYHNLDAEVELTSILSEQIALEIDREILADLVVDATAGVYYWSRSPGMFLNRTTGAEVGAGASAPDFTGNVSEWYETLIETINDVSAQIHRKVLRGGATFLVCGPEVANILEFTSGFRANVTHDDDRGVVGAVKAGNLSKKWDVFVDPYFPRNVVLVGRKGGSFLESGYVYAPYVPLQVTPTIFGIDDFVPRKGVLTRYGKKMVRPDMYGLVVVRGLLGETGGA